MLAAILKLGGAAEAGRFSLGLAISTPILMFANLQLRTVLATDARGEFAFADYVGARTMATVVASIGVLLVAWTSGYTGSVFLSIGLVTTMKVVGSFGDLQYGLLQRSGQLQVVAVSMIATGVLSVVGVAVTMATINSLNAALAAAAVAYLSVLLLYTTPRSAIALAYQLNGDRIDVTVRPRFALPVIWKIVILTLPLGFASLLGSLSVNAPRLLIEQFEGIEKLGIFAALAYTIQTGRTIVSAVTSSVAPRLARYVWLGDSRGFFRLVRLQLLICGAIITIGITGGYLFGKPIVTFIYSKDVAAYQTLLILLIVAGGFEFMGSILASALTAARSLHSQMLIEAIALAVALLACFLLVPQFGLTGAGVAVLVSSAARLAGMALPIPIAFAKVRAHRGDGFGTIGVVKEISHANEHQY